MKWILFLSLTFSFGIMAHEHSSKKEVKSASVEEIVKEGKKIRKKRVQMCHDCGKPESDCTCKGH